MWTIHLFRLQRFSMITFYENFKFLFIPVCPSGNRNQFETEEACLKFCLPDYKPKIGQQ